MEKELVVLDSFEEKMRERLRESIGELLSNEDLRKLIITGVNDVFFTEHEIGNGYNKKVSPALVQSMVKEYIKPMVEEEVQNWIKEHSEEIKEEVNRMVNEGAGYHMIKGIEAFFKDSFENLGRDIRYKLGSGY